MSVAVVNNSLRLPPIVVLIQIAQTPQHLKEEKKKKREEQQAKRKKPRVAVEEEDKEPLHVFFDIEAMQTQERHKANLLIAEKEEEEASHAFRGQRCVKDFCCGWNSWWKRKIGI